MDSDSDDLARTLIGEPSSASDGENSPVEQVALTVPPTDDPSLPVVTFRMWILGAAACVLLSFLNQFFCLNPGRFNVKEHVLITIFANSGAANPYSIHIVSAVKIFYGRKMTFWVWLGVVLTTQILGFGWAGLLRRYLVKFCSKDLWLLSKSAFKEKTMDVHTKLMLSYKKVPEWWFLCILFINIAVTLLLCQFNIDQLQLPWWGVLLACALAFFFTLPVGVIAATTNQIPGLNVITEYLIGFLYPGYPVANMCFKVYGYISMKQALVVGTLISSVVHLGTAWWLMDTFPNICDRTVLPSSSPWTCPSDHVFYDASVVWGLIGPQRIFGNLGFYSAINWAFLVGAVAPVVVWVAIKAFPGQQWLKQVSVPVMLVSVINMPPATAVNYNSWIILGIGLHGSVPVSVFGDGK
ncbi:hypothetical protein SASPL_154772 [Salvia splendens]|uniref:Oligopeptide transporter n=1 Tax=Salvia splendens TaxID=180675 RepID=A0A8X8YZK3_SALSN|nr:hypothetical protein SASPL_154772 [Salvia splendens]